MPDLRKISIFNGRLETLNLALPSGLLIMALIEIFFIGSLYGSLSALDLPITIILNAVFFNTTHVLLTFLMLLKVPQMKLWAASQRRLWLKAISVYLIFFVLFLFFFLKVNTSMASTLRFVLLGFLPLHHVLWQSRGLSLLYNQQIKNRGEIPIKAINRSEKFERYGFYLFFLSLVAVNQLFKEPSAWRAISWCGVIGGGFLIFLGAALFPGVFRSNKIAFLSRVAAYPLAKFSFFAMASSSVAHGVEYLCVFDKINTNAFAEKKLRRLIYSMAFGILLLYGVVFSWLKSVQVPFANGPLPLWISLLEAAVTSLTFVHYYIDRILFRMRDPETRSHISPLLSA